MSFALSGLSPLYAASQALRGPSKQPKINDPYATPKGFSEFSTLNRAQGGLMDQIIALLSGQGGGQSIPGLEYLQQLSQGSPEAFEKFEAPYLRQFHEQTIPQIAERFAGLGATSSSGFQQALGGAAGGLQENLASLRSQLQFKSSEDLLNTILQVLGINTRGLVEKPQSGWQRALSSFAGGVGQALPSLAFL